METTVRGRPNFVWLALAALAFAVAFLSVAAPSRHAVERHGNSAWRVTRRMGDADPGDDDTWSKVCPDGKRYTFHRTADGNAYDVSIDTPDLSANFTRFSTTNDDWIARKLAWCE